MGAGRTYLGAFLTLISVVAAFFLIVGLAVGDCATEACAAHDNNRPLWALATIVGTVVANVVMWWRLSRRGD